jgi:hypothetical protein
MEKSIVFTEMPLKANEIITTEITNAIDLLSFGAVEVVIATDVAGTLYFEESDDKKTWSTSGTFPVEANKIKRTGALLARKQFYRFKYVNGNKRQTRIKSVINLIDNTNVDPSFKTVKAAGDGTGNATINLPEAVTRINSVITINGIEVSVPSAITAFEDDFESFTSFSVQSTGDWLYTVKS